MQRTIETAQNLDFPKLTWKALDELDAGVCDGMTYEEIEVRAHDYARGVLSHRLRRRLIQKILLTVMMTNSITDIEVGMMLQLLLSANQGSERGRIIS